MSERTERRVPRWLWRLIYFLGYVVGMIPWMIISVKFPWNLSNVEILAKAFVFAVYAKATFDGIEYLMVRVFGPLNPKPIDVEHAEGR
ncbi:MAG TPA: hypothetical protein VMF31_10065 [Solirubrobacterales bacterium]|nr:hypothetical protein [Solirubrobacterales bacterium]